MKSKEHIAESGQIPPLANASRRHPSHLIVFRECNDKNVAVLADVLRIKECQKQEATYCHRFDPNSEGRCGASLLQRLAIASADIDPDEELRLLRHPAVQRVTPNTTRSIPQMNRPVTATALNGAANGATELPMQDWHVNRVGADQSRSNGHGILVGVLDTGFDSRHPDLNGRVQASINLVPSESPEDENGHGTSCAALIAGNGTGRVAQYSVSPGAKLLVAKVLNKKGTGHDDAILEGIAWAAENGARIISMSLGSVRAANGAFPPAYEQMASQLLGGDPGVLILAAAGNDSDRQQGIVSPVRNPAACPSICAVAAVDQNGDIANNSSGGADPIGEVNFSAPGVMVFSASAGPIYRYVSGTSAATPVAAGVAALLLQENPSLKATQLWSLLETRAQPRTTRTDYGAGIVRV